MLVVVRVNGLSVDCAVTSLSGYEPNSMTSPVLYVSDPSAKTVRGATVSSIKKASVMHRTWRTMRRLLIFIIKPPLFIFVFHDVQTKPVSHVGNTAFG